MSKRIDNSFKQTKYFHAETTKKRVRTNVIFKYFNRKNYRATLIMSGCIFIATKFAIAIIGGDNQFSVDAMRDSINFIIGLVVAYSISKQIEKNERGNE